MLPRPVLRPPISPLPAIACCAGSIGCCPADRGGLRGRACIPLCRSSSLRPLRVPASLSCCCSDLAHRWVWCLRAPASALPRWRSRSSWLSREGVFSVLTFLPAAVFGIGWVFFGTTGGLVGLCGILAAALAATTIYCTGMIYASLKPIHQWHNPWVVPNYFALGLMSALLVLDFLVRLWQPRAPGVAVATAILVFVAWWLKEGYWRSIDTNSAPSTVASATLLGSRGKVRMLEPP